MNQNRKQEGDDDGPWQEHRSEVGGSSETVPHQGITQRLSIVVKANPIGRIVCQILVVSKADPNDPDNGVDLVPYEEENSWQQKDPVVVLNKPGFSDGAMNGRIPSSHFRCFPSYWQPEQCYPKKVFQPSPGK